MIELEVRVPSVHEGLKNVVDYVYTRKSTKASHVTVLMACGSTIADSVSVLRGQGLVSLAKPKPKPKPKPAPKPKPKPKPEHKGYKA